MLFGFIKCGVYLYIEYFNFSDKNVPIILHISSPPKEMVRSNFGATKQLTV